MAMLDAKKISQAVTACLQRCYGSRSPLVALAEFLGELEQQRDWSRYEIDAVEIRVLRVLNRIVSESTEDTTKL